MIGFYTKEELQELGLKSVGNDVLISTKASIYNPQYISIGDNVRIDDFCLLSASSEGITIGSHIHIGAFNYMAGAGEIILEDFSGLSPRSSIFSGSDSFSGDFLIGPTVPLKYRKVRSGVVHLKKHANVATNCTILPEVILDIGSAVLANSLVTQNCDAFSIYSGVPAKKVKERSRKILDLEEKFLNDLANLAASNKKV